MGLSQVSSLPIFVSADLMRGGRLADGTALSDYALVAQDLGASVIGFATAEGPDAAAEYAAQVRDAAGLPVMVQLVVGERSSRQQGPTPENPYYCADMMVDAAAKLYRAGAQFLRAAGNATPAYTGALAATVHGLDVVVR